MKSKKYVFFEYLIALSIILNTRSIYLHISQNSNNIFTLIVLLILTIGCFGCLFCCSSLKTARIDISMAYILFFILYLGAYILFRPTDLIADLFYLSSFCLLILFYFSCGAYSKIGTVPTILIRYKNLVYILSAYSIVMWLLCVRWQVIQPSGTLYSTWANNTINNFYWIYFQTQAQRNTSIFTEAPMSSLHFSVALMIELFLTKNFSKIKVVVLTIAIFTTSSVTGAVLVCLSFAAKYFLYRPKRKVFRQIKPVVLGIGVIVAGLYCFDIITERLATRSGIVRVNDIINCFLLWSEYPIFGIGGGDIADEILSGSSNSLGRLFAERGLYVGILYIISFLIAIKAALKNRDYNLLFFIMLFFYLFFLTIIQYTYLTMIILIYFVSQRRRRKRLNYDYSNTSSKHCCTGSFCIEKIKQ